MLETIFGAHPPLRTVATPVRHLPHLVCVEVRAEGEEVRSSWPSQVRGFLRRCPQQVKSTRCETRHHGGRILLRRRPSPLADDYASSATALHAYVSGRRIGYMGPMIVVFGHKLAGCSGGRSSGRRGSRLVP